MVRTKTINLTLLYSNHHAREGLFGEKKLKNLFGINTNQLTHAIIVEFLRSCGKMCKKIPLLYVNFFHKVEKLYTLLFNYTYIVGFNIDLNNSYG